VIAITDEDARKTGGPMSDFQDLGGQDTVKQVVERFYQLVLDDGTLAPYFDGVDMQAVKRHQVLLLSQVMGGPEGYAGRGLDEAHASLGVTDGDFSRVAGYLAAALAESGASDQVIARVGETVESTREQIVNSPRW
jgi:hemoglobin